MRKTLGASVLMLVLCGPAFAGDILCPPGAAPPPPNGMQAEETTGGEGETGVADGLTEAVLSVLESVLALL